MRNTFAYNNTKTHQIDGFLSSAGCGPLRLLGERVSQIFRRKICGGRTRTGSLRLWALYANPYTTPRVNYIK